MVSRLIALVACLTAQMITGSARAQEVLPLKGADLNLYFNGGTEEQVLSAGTVLLFNLPAPRTDPSGFDPIHHDIAGIAQRLGNDVALVPLSQVWPVADARARRWLRLMRCPSLSSLRVSKQIPVLFVSIASPNGRACIGTRASGADVAQLAEMLLDQEERGCRLNAQVQSRLFDWVNAHSQRLRASAALAESAAFKTEIAQAQRDYCALSN